MVSCFKEFRTKLYTVLALGCLLCGVTLAQNVQTGYLPGVDFSKYHTYRWVGLMDQRLPQRRKVPIDVGTIFLDIYDTAANRLVWEGSASKTLDPKSSSKVRRTNIDKAAKKLLANFPPGRPRHMASSLTPRRPSSD